MRILFLFLFTFFLTFIYSQPKENDSLKKYSYSIIGFGFDNPPTYAIRGSCFFIRNQNKVYLITARHVITGCRHETRKKNYPVQFNILIRDSNSIFVSMLKINVPQSLVIEPCVPNMGNIDIIAFEIKNEKTSEIYSVEKFLLPPFPKISTIEIYGFPESSYAKNEVSLNYLKPAHLHIRSKDYSIITSVTYTDRKEIDSNNLLILDKYLHLDTASLLGYSGSPVFLKESNCNRLRLIGVFSGFGYNKTYKKRAFLSIAKLDSDVFDITKYIQH